MLFLQLNSDFIKTKVKKYTKINPKRKRQTKLNFFSEPLIAPYLPF